MILILRFTFSGKLRCKLTNAYAKITKKTDEKFTKKQKKSDVAEDRTCNLSHIDPTLCALGYTGKLVNVGFLLVLVIS